MALNGNFFSMKPLKNWAPSPYSTHRLHSSSFLGLLYRILNMNPKRNYNGAYRYPSAFKFLLLLLLLVLRVACGNVYIQSSALA